MKPRNEVVPRRPRNNTQGEGPNWILIAGSALLSTLSVRLGYKLKQALDAKQANNRSHSLKAVGKSNPAKKSGSCHLHSNGFSFAQGEDGKYNDFAASGPTAEPNQHLSGQNEMALPLATVPALEFNNIEPAHHRSNGSDSPCLSESSSDIFSKRDVVQKLRQQLKRRDDMILEMQHQLAELQASLNTEQLHSSHLQSMLDAANRDMFDSEREIQRLRKAIADHCVGQPPTVPLWPGPTNDHTQNGNGYAKVESEKVEKIEMLRSEVAELKESNEAKDYLLRSYKEQKSELSMKVQELQQRLDSQLPSIL